MLSNVWQCLKLEVKSETMREMINFSRCKPLGVLWGKFPQFSAKNSVIFDDVRHNFLMAPKSGLKVNLELIIVLHRGGLEFMVSILVK